MSTVRNEFVQILEIVCSSPNLGIIITTGGFIFTWSPYAIALFVSAFRGKDFAIPPLITFYCACFAKSSVIWIPLLYIGTSTQFHFSLVNLKAIQCRNDSTEDEAAPQRTLAIVCQSDGSILIRPVNQDSAKKNLFPVTPKVYHA